MTDPKPNPTFEQRLEALERAVSELTVVLKAHDHLDGKIVYRLD